ncbi:hypothetical protein F5883DRAFT_670235 [Diaporthe sp. PMI_573]|nr:hypothetical protein F5883DRAFT_670235 [Diaporthaceae sp. PMI_573]
MPLDDAAIGQMLAAAAQLSAQREKIPEKLTEVRGPKEAAVVVGAQQVYETIPRKLWQFLEILLHFFHHRSKHKACLTQRLLTVDDVKEHMWTSHRRPNFCPICKETFDTMRARDDYIHRESPTFEGLTDGQIQQIARQKYSSSSMESQWYALWEIICPSMRKCKCFPHENARPNAMTK